MLKDWLVMPKWGKINLLNSIGFIISGFSTRITEKTIIYSDVSDDFVIYLFFYTNFGLNSKDKFW